MLNSKERSDLASRLTRYVDSRGEMPQSERDQLWRNQVFHHLRQYVDEWIRTGIDENGTEFPFQGESELTRRR
jgi:hypothetical protein